MVRKKFCKLLILIPILFVSLTSCWNSREINTLAITVCTGIDKVEDGYMLTQQVIDPKSITSEGGSSESPVVIYSDTGEDLFEIKRKLTSQIPRKIFNSHLKIVILGEEVAKSGIEEIIDFFARGHEYRTDFYFVIAKGTTAKNLLSVLTPLESIPGINYYHSLDASEANWAPTKSTKIIELINTINAEGNNPVITGLEFGDGFLNARSTEDLNKNIQLKNPKYNGLGVFKGDKLVGWMNEDESKGYNYILGNVKSTVGHVYYDNNIKISLEVLNASSDIKVSMEKEAPVINITIKIVQDVGTVKGQFDVTKLENKEIINKLTEQYIEKLCTKSIEKAQIEFNADVFGFGEAIHRKYPKLWNELKSEWDNYFPKLKVNIKVDAKTKKLGQILKPIFMKEKQ